MKKIKSSRKIKSMKSGHHHHHQSSNLNQCRLFLAIALFLLALISVVECGANKKFLTGFLVAILLAMRQGSPAQPVYNTYAPPPPPAYPSQPSVYVIPVGPGGHYY